MYLGDLNVVARLVNECVAFFGLTTYLYSLYSYTSPLEKLEPTLHLEGD